MVDCLQCFNTTQSERKFSKLRSSYIILAESWHQRRVRFLLAREVHEKRFWRGTNNLSTEFVPLQKRFCTLPTYIMNLTENHFFAYRNSFFPADSAAYLEIKENNPAQIVNSGPCLVASICRARAYLKRIMAGQGSDDRAPLTTSPLRLNQSVTRIVIKDGPAIMLLI
jgi:hypothetical protein